MPEESHPIGTEKHDEDTGLKSHHTPHSSFEMDLPFFTTEILDTLAEQDQLFVACLMMRQPQQAIADKYNTSRRKVQEAYNRFKEILQQIIQRADLTEKEVRIIIENLVQTWQDELFSAEQGET